MAAHPWQIHGVSVCLDIPSLDDCNGCPMASWHGLSERLVQNLDCALSFQGGSGEASGSKGFLSEYHSPCALAGLEVVLKSLNMGG
eukprot:2758385-Amphidinium_carterae.2